MKKSNNGAEEFTLLGVLLLLIGLAAMLFVGILGEMDTWRQCAEGLLRCS